MAIFIVRAGAHKGAAKHEGSLLWNDPAVGVQWPMQCQPQLAAKDAAGKSLAEAEVFG